MINIIFVVPWTRPILMIVVVGEKVSLLKSFRILHRATWWVENEPDRIILTIGPNLLAQATNPTTAVAVLGAAAAPLKNTAGARPKPLQSSTIHHCQIRYSKGSKLVSTTVE